MALLKASLLDMTVKWHDADVESSGGPYSNDMERYLCLFEQTCSQTFGIDTEAKTVPNGTILGFEHWFHVYFLRISHAITVPTLFMEFRPPSQTAAHSIGMPRARAMPRANSFEKVQTVSQKNTNCHTIPASQSTHHFECSQPKGRRAT